ncbi:glycoside hydrolase family 9 protein [Vibrio tapetis subsp. quintayensis]|uniref:glycoside hydrolase family 9 protein n=1 Tax=Vibrio tapetis TaxID=52443 RepID=UPI0025B5CC59|nr:glycoside hydrolase family 9 protein [Vibrio tapetis]MDN3678854.1 glycoside hydrolase family 9 protein [Vibrio tapetis subsp. quintayensis]
MSNRFTWVIMVGCVLNAPSILAEEMIRNGLFGNAMDGWWNAGGSVAIGDSEVCIEIGNPGSNTWDIILGQGGVGLEKGEAYELNFDARSNIDTQVKTLIQHEGPPYTHHFVTDTLLTQQRQSYHYKFIQENDSDAGAEFQFQMGAQKKATICVSNVSLQGKPYTETAKISPIRLNQIGFLPKSNKLVFIASDSTEPLRWVMKNADGISTDMGRTIPTGMNKASGENLHKIDLTAYTSILTGLSVVVDGESSFPFDINSSIYQQLKYDALSYFYQNRSGIAIDKQYVQRDDLARPAGHPSDVVTCFDKQDAWGNHWPGCDFEVDVTGGWYDAGDHGKYTVNSGISTWTLLNLYERGLWVNGASMPFDDARMPEENDGVNGLLSEARWNVEFMLAMQIPPGKQVYAPIGDQSASKKLTLTKIDASNMAFHKVADEAWTGMPLPPHKDPQKRYVGQPSTAATLNLAAIGAQCARIWRDIDVKFAQRCLASAESAWQSAQQHQDIYAYNNFTGSGPYDDLELADEFYWAAAELYITTSNDAYKDVVQSSPLYLNVPKGNVASEGDMFWQYTAPLGTISLAIVPNQLGSDAIKQAQQAIIGTADNYQSQMKNEGYNIPYSVTQYPWGSNSNLVNRSLFLVYANDFTSDVRYLKSAASAMDYILGANPINISYVTGYGSNFAKNPHHRFWAKAADENSPSPAPGALIGGPNSVSFSDPIAAKMKGNCVGQTCYRDNINAWSLNEITINWNAPLVWVSAALDEGKLNH